ncbi:unnamed protein product [Paramecium pentaurelia]|uniref:Casein kinase I n=1 Tax=Paramecium pentaurelia TaxID=43138 RepID=A0A8S1XGA9_9CILI|nr:unnamed protein product [Paramecium pentaurelia]
MNLKNSEYKMISNLGSSSDHIVFKAQHNLTQDVCAIKIEKKPGIGQIENEISILQQLFGIEGIPKLIHNGKTKDLKNYLIIPLLKCSLQDLAKSNLLSLNSILAIGLSLIRTIKQVHNRGILHLDIKPENIMISSCQIIDSVEQILTPGNVQLIDFGLSQNLRNPKFLKETFIGSLRFASRQSHNKQQLGYKDDIESLLYVLAYLRNKKLPWQQTQQLAFQLMDIKKIGMIKDQVYETALLSQQFPPQFYQFQLYIDTLTHSTMPDYNYIEELFKQMLQINQIPISPRFPEPTAYFPKYNDLEDQEYIKMNESISSRDGDTRAIIVSDLIKAYTTIKIKSIKDIHFRITIKQIY